MTNDINCDCPPITSPPSGRIGIHASFASLALAFVGFLSWGIGYVLAAPNVATYPGQLSWILQVVGPILLAVAVTLHVDHLSYRIGRSAVLLTIFGSFMVSVSFIPFMIKPANFMEVGWSDWANAFQGVAWITLGLGLASIAIHKEKQMERGLAQVGDVGDTDQSNVSVHASFFSLITASIGLSLMGLMYLMLIGHPVGGRAAWTTQLVGMMLVAVGVISHVEHLGRHIGKAAVALAALAAALMAVSVLPYAYNPSNFAAASWGKFFWVLSGASAISAAMAIGLVILRKRSVEAELAKS